MNRLYALSLLFLSLQPLSAQSKFTATSVLEMGFEQGSSLRLLVMVEEQKAAISFAEQGIMVGTKAGNIWTVTVNAEQLRWMKSAPEVKLMEMGKAIIPSQRHDLPSNSSLMVTKVQQNPLGYGIHTPFTGKDVIIGIVDIGFQPDHPTFYDTNGVNNRVVRYWDQLDNSGNPPAGFNYGSLHSSLPDMTAKVYNAEIHGTHVAGIAAGSGYGSPNRNYAGVAYEAELVFVNIKYYDDNLPPSAKGDLFVASPTIIDGVDYIFRYADSVGKPAVVNLSWGMHTGPHDGTSLFDLAIDNLVRQGRIFVGAGGNSGWSRTHVGRRLNGDTLRTLPFNSRNVRDDIEDNYIDIWGSAGTEFQISLGLADTNGVLLGNIAFVSSHRDTVISGLLTVPNGLGSFDSLVYELHVVSNYAANNKPNILIEMWNHTPQTRRTTLFITSDSSEVHAWNSGQIYSWGGGGFAASFFGQAAWPGFTNGNAEYVIGENGGTGRNTITAGAYNASETRQALDGSTHWGGWGNISGFSSHGPTVDGRIKPDIAAPGENVISAYNRNAYAPYQRNSIIDTFVWKGKTEYYGTASGTSMAAPNAAGVIALFLQLNDTLGTDLMKEILFASATADKETGAVPNNTWGHGKVNAYEGLRYIQTSVGMPSKASSQWIVYPNPSAGNFSIAGAEPNARFRVFDMQGRMLVSDKLINGKATINLPHGLYALVVESANGTRSFRIQIQ